MESVIKRSFGFNLRILQALHLSLPENPTNLYKLKICIMYFLVTLPLPILGILHFLLESDVDAMRASDNAFVIAIATCYAAKLLPLISNSDQIRRCIHYFENPIFEGLTKKQVEIMDKCVKICRRNCAIFLICVFGGTVNWATKPLFGHLRKLPVDIWLPLDLTTRPQIYCLVYFIMVAVLSYPVLACCVIDPMIGGLACLATGQLMVLKDNLRHLSEYAEREIATTDNVTVLRDKIIYDKIKRCINHHYAILKFGKEYEEGFSWVVFSQLVGSIFVLGFCCLQLVLMDPSSLDFYVMLSYCIVLLAQIYLYCYYGTALYEESDSVTNAIYMDKWYEYDIKSRKALIILMERAKRPMTVRSGKILDFSLATFTTILRRAYSLLAVLRNYK